MSKRVKEEIAFYKDLLKITSAFSFGIGGGTVGLIFKLKDPIHLILFTLGTVLEAVLEVGLLIVSACLIDGAKR